MAIAQTSGVIIGESLILPGVISDSDISVLYRCADPFVFPSVKEGWGLVLLEAIAQAMLDILGNDTITVSYSFLARYSWAKSAQMHLNLYRQLLQYAGN
ncbi:glycosyltransferase [Gloeocapsa sp. PCC 73106]|uniref:glycosyltransferase n=1 Tax=Gloeocapsa sp. PCC 73106 TaxID=102232 RepID=UPI0002ACCA8A|nr:glycosyltransferase [Gloeocapsa sp. PCC 73106]ELR98209.1 glycosyltransferase [Gloeocapsa sp. PCC 73106]